MGMSRSGRTFKPLNRLIEMMNIAADAFEPVLTVAEEHYFDAMEKHCDGTWNNIKQVTFKETCLVGAGIGGRFTNTNELHVMKYDEAMASYGKQGCGRIA